MREGAVARAVARERAEHVRGNVGLRGDVEPRRADVALDLRFVCHSAEIGIEEFSAAPQDAVDRVEERVLPRVAVRSLDVDDRIEMILREVKRLRVACAEVNAERAVRPAVVCDGVLILVNRRVGFGLVIAFDERRAAPVPATDLEHVPAREVIAAGDVVIELNRGTVDLILRLECDHLAFGGPETVIQKRNRFVAHAAREVLIPVLPKELLEGGHGSPRFDR